MKLPVRVMVALIFSLIFFAYPQHHSVLAQENDGSENCLMGVYVQSLYNLDVPAGTFDADLWLWTNCPTQKFEPLEWVEYINAIEATPSLYYQQEAGGVWWSGEKLEGTFRYNWDIRNYPFDRQTLRIILENTWAQRDISAYIADTRASTYDPEMVLAGWRITDFKVTEAGKTYNTVFGDPEWANKPPERTSSQLLIDISLARTELTSFLKLTAPVYIAFLISLISYLLFVESSGVLAAQIGLLAGALFAIVINMQIASSILGSEGGLTLLDEIHIVALIYILIGTLMAVYSTLLIRRDLPLEKVEWLNYRILAISFLSFVAINAILIAWAAYVG